jgi:transposase
MLTWGDDVEVHALRKRGWSISAIARHTGRDRKTVRAYLNGDRTPGVRARAVDAFAPFLEYVTARLADDPHLWALTLFDELLALGFVLSYQSLTREIRNRELRPVCTACAGATGRVNAVIEHPPGAETQWDWLELPDPPPSWGWGKTAHLLVGSLAHSGKWRAVLSPSEDQPHLIDALDRITRALGGVTHAWRFDRMATVCHPDTGRVTASFAGVAKHYGVSVSICPPRSGHRKGVVEKINHTAAQRWWRTLSDELTVEQAQAGVDTFAATRGDTRMRAGHLDAAGSKATVATVATTEPLHPAPVVAYPVIITEQRVVSRQALVAYRGNRYSVPPELAGTQVAVTRPVGGECIDIATSTGPAAGIVIARHRLVGDGTGAVIRETGHVIALEAAALAAVAGGGTDRPHRRKERIPPGPAAIAAAAALRPDALPSSRSSTDTVVSTVIDLAAYERAATGRNTLT